MTFEVTRQNFNGVESWTIKRDGRLLLATANPQRASDTLRTHNAPYDIDPATGDVIPCPPVAQQARMAYDAYAAADMPAPSETHWGKKTATPTND